MNQGISRANLRIIGPCVICFSSAWYWILSKGLCKVQPARSSLTEPHLNRTHRWHILNSCLSGRIRCIKPKHAKAECSCLSTYYTSSDICGKWLCDIWHVVASLSLQTCTVLYPFLGFVSSCQRMFALHSPHIPHTTSMPPWPTSLDCGKTDCPPLQRDHTFGFSNMYLWGEGGTVAFVLANAHRQIIQINSICNIVLRFPGLTFRGYFMKSESRLVM